MIAINYKYPLLHIAVAPKTWERKKMKRTKLITLVIVGIMISATLVTCVHADGSIGNATFIPPGTYYGNLNETHTIDWYNFTAYNGHLINVTMIPPVDADFQLELCNPTGILKNASYNGVGQTENVLYYADSDGTWSIRVSRYIGQGTYTLILAPVNYAPATPSPPSGPASGYVYTSYTFNASTTDPESDNIYYEFDWNDSTSTTLVGPYASGATASAQHSWKYPTSYQPKVRAKDAHGFWSSWSNAASLTLGQDDAFAHIDAGSTFSSAIIIAPGTYKGTLYYPNYIDTVDYYNFTVSPGDFVWANMTPPPDADFQLELYDSNGEIISGSYNGVGQTEIVQGTATSNAMWAIRISRYTGEGQYNFTLIIAPNHSWLCIGVPQAPPEGVTIKIDGVSYVAFASTPVNVTLANGNHTLEAQQGFLKEEWMPGTYFIYTFLRWSDGVTNRIRTISLTSNTSLTAIYLRSKYGIN